MLAKELQMDDLRDDAYQKLYLMHKEHQEIYKKLYSFFRNTEEALSMLGDDKRLLSDLIQEYDEISRQLTESEKDLNEFYDLEESDQNEVFTEVTKVLGIAKLFVLKLPELLMTTDIAQDIIK